MARNYTNPNTRALTSKTFIGKLAETLGLIDGLSPNQKKTKKPSLSQKSVVQALKRAGIKGAVITYSIDSVMTALKNYSETPERKAALKEKTEKQNKNLANKNVNLSRVVNKSKTESPPSKGKVGRGKLKRPTESKTVTVKSGDTLTKIAKDKNISLPILKKLNPNIKDYNKIKPGQKIRVGGSK
tara:strand:- start:1650 stop:2204 length:555 start_codon:yes stop_codon:yes gene_type:complete